MLDYGDTPIVMLAGSYNLEVRAGKLMIEAWDETRSLSRHVLSIDRKATGVLDCTVQRFGGKSGVLTVLDLDRPQVSSRTARAVRQSFAEQFRRILRRQFPAWEIDALTTAMDLRRSFSAVFPRSHLHRGNSHIASLGCVAPEDESELLCSALLWYDYIRGHVSSSDSVSLVLFLPASGGKLTAHRLRWLTGRPLNARIFLFNEHGMAGEVDPGDLGNVETRLTSRYAPERVAPAVHAAMIRLAKQKEIGCCPEVNGAWSIRFRGLEFARIEGDAILLGIDEKNAIGITEFGQVENFAQHLTSLASSPRSGAPGLPAFPERWFESVVRAHLEVLDPELLPEPVHGQILTFAGMQRESIDLLARSRSGRLTILELKTSEDIQLPIQALDYWIRIGWHAERGELDPLFPGAIVSKDSPKLLLVAPALSFHPSNEILLRYFSPEIEVERIGVNSDWESTLQAALRLRGAEVPLSHQRNR